MLDVHAPHGRTEGIKDFLLHIFTITVGLLIALALEGCAERHHKAELRKEAEANLRKEIRDNQKEVTEWLGSMRKEQQDLIRVLGYVAAKKAGAPYDSKGVSMGFEVRQLSDASWRTAAATGALSLMEYNQVQEYASAYRIQDQVQLLEQATLDDYLRMQSYILYGLDPHKLSAAEATAAEPEVRHALAHLKATEDLAEGLKTEYRKALDGK